MPPQKEVACGRPDRYRYRELAHLEIICAIIYQLTKNLTPEQLKPLVSTPIISTTPPRFWPTAAAGVPFNACEFQSKGDAITDLHEDLAAEQKARTTYDNLIRVIDNPEVLEPLNSCASVRSCISSGSARRWKKIKSQLDAKNFYYFNAV